MAMTGPLLLQIGRSGQLNRPFPSPLEFQTDHGPPRRMVAQNPSARSIRQNRDGLIFGIDRVNRLEHAVGHLTDRCHLITGRIDRWAGR